MSTMAQTTTPRGDGGTGTVTVGSYLATRLAQIGLKHHFVVAGDYNLILLDQLLLNKNMQQVYCCNELNCVFFCRRLCACQRCSGVRGHLQCWGVVRIRRACRGVR